MSVGDEVYPTYTRNADRMHELVDGRPLESRKTIFERAHSLGFLSCARFIVLAFVPPKVGAQSKEKNRPHRNMAGKALVVMRCGRSGWGQN
jgi:hypothetical protein